MRNGGTGDKIRPGTCRYDDNLDVAFEAIKGPHPLVHARLGRVRTCHCFRWRLVGPAS
jgi:hypothetical protein